MVWITLRVFIGLFFTFSLKPIQGSEIRNLASLGPGGGGGVLSAVFHNTHPNIILLGQDVGGIDKSTDGGLTWRHVNSRGLARPDFTLDVYWVEELVDHPTDNSRFFACTASGLFRSDDVGESWELVIPISGSSTPEFPVSWIAFSPLNDNLGLLGTGGWHEPDEGFGMYRSTDGGATFAHIQADGIPGAAGISSIVFDPDDGTVYVSTTSGLFRSTDNGDFFNKVNFAFRHDRGQWVGIGGTGGQKTFWYVLYTEGEDGNAASRSSGIYRSSDALTWTEITGEPTVNDPENNELMRTLGAQVHPGDPSILLLNLRTNGGEGGLFRYDGGWTDLTSSFVDTTWDVPDFSAISPECVTVNASDPNLIISCNEKAVLKTTNGGKSWTQMSTKKVGEDGWVGTGTEVLDAYDLAATSDGVLYVAFEDVGFWTSNDRSASWKQLLWPGAVPDTIRPDGATEVYVNPLGADRLYVALGSFSNDLRESDVRSEIHKSTDGGVTTMDVTPPAAAKFLGRPALAVVWGDDPSQDTLYAVFHGDTIYKSTDGGVNWIEISNGISAEDRKVIFRITVDPSDPNTVYAGLYTFFGDFTSQGGLYRSTDGGASWTRLEGYPYQDVGVIRFVGSPQRLFVGGWTLSNGGLRVSDDDTKFTEVLNQPFVTDLIDVSGSPGTLYASSSATFQRGTNQNAGLYQSTDNGATWIRLEGNLQVLMGSIKIVNNNRHMVHALAVFVQKFLMRAVAC